MTNKIITIDGPAASGKSSVSRELARKLNWKWVSTGAFYRGLAYVAMREGLLKQNGVGLTFDTQALTKLAQSKVWEVRLDEDQTRVFYKGQDITAEIHAEENGTRASSVSQDSAVRLALLDNQRNCARDVAGLVAEGRDCGTVVFPNALLKIYLTASQEERAIRRAKEQGVDVKAIQSQQVARDQRDSSRAAAPLQIPPNAKVVDSGGMNLSEVVQTVYSWAQEALAQSVKSF